MSRKKIKKEIKELKGQLRTANRKTALRLIKLLFVLVILAIVVAYLQGRIPLNIPRFW
jgi:cell division septal protein FtsQ